MSNTQIRSAVGLLLILNLALPVLLGPVGAPVGNDATALRIGYLTIGAVMAQPALLAVRGALAPQPLLLRGAQSLALIACTNLAIDFAMVHYSGSRNEPADILQIIASLVAFAVCLLPLWLSRARFR